ncbi:hypothetical protein [Neptunomonas phycophila]|uniref:hypothetical protein n=1 Tax=Neptunomonas phycophila TaxID=1572645 RepID=UPI0030F6AD6A
MNFFILSKPSQIVTILNIIEQESLRDNVLFILDKFVDSKGFSEKVSDFPIFNAVHFCKDRSNALLKKIRFYGFIGSLYTDSDVFFSGFLNLCSFLKGKVWVYDEGFYSYVSDLGAHLKRQSKSIKSFSYRCLGLSFYHGGHFFTNGIYLYRPYLYSKENVKRINVGFCKYYLDNKIIFDGLFYVDLPDSLVSKSKVVIYCTSHSADKFYDYIKVNEVDIVKPHPILSLKSNVGYMADPVVPVEFIALSLIAKGVKINFVHEGSTAVFNLYSLDEGSINFINVENFVDSFSEFYNQCLKEIKDHEVCNI